jgi:uncharacterized protein YrrD
MVRFSAESLLRLPVRMNGIQLGYPVDVVIDPGVRRVLGLDVHCGDDAHRFLPLSAARVDADELAIGSTLTLLDTAELTFYRKRGTTLRTLRGVPVSRAGRVVGTLQDVIASADGAIFELVVDGGARVSVDDRLRISGEPRRLDAA